MKIWKVLAAVAALTLTGAGLSYADDAPATPPATKPAEAKHVNGAIKEIATGDTPDLTITTGRGSKAKTETVSTTADTVVKIGKDTKTLKDLTVGARVSITLDANGKAATINVYVMRNTRGAAPGAAAPGAAGGN